MIRSNRPEADWGVLFVAMFLGPSLGTVLLIVAAILLTGAYQACLLLFTQPDVLLQNLLNPDQIAEITGTLIIVLLVAMFAGLAGVPAASASILIMHFFSQRRPIDGALFGSAAGVISILGFLFMIGGGVEAAQDPAVFVIAAIFLVAGASLGWLTCVRAYRDGRAKLEAETKPLHAGRDASGAPP